MDETYSVGEFAELTGVTVRTLHHFEERGLLKPRRMENGYRVYGPAEVDRMQQIMLYREMGVELADIRKALDDPEFDRKRALRQHLEGLYQKRGRIDELVKSVEKTLASMEGGAPMSAKEKFEAFKRERVDENERRYGKEARERWGDEAVDASNRKAMGMSEEQYARLQAYEAQVKEAVLAGLADGDESGEHAKAATAAHAEWLKMNWPDGLYNASSHVCVAYGYLADERFKAYYDAWAPGATEFLVSAIERYANEL